MTIELLNKIKSTRIARDVLDDFLYSVLNTMVEYYGLEYTTDKKLLFTYTPSKSNIDYQMVVTSNLDDILSFVDIKLPSEDSYGLISLYELFESIIKSNKFNKHIYSISEMLKYIGKDDLMRKKTVFYFNNYVKTIQGSMYKYPYEDLLCIAILDYHFPDADIHGFISNLINKPTVKDFDTSLDKATLFNWIPELGTLSDAYVLDFTSEFERHVKMVYKLKMTDYLQRMTIQDIQEDLAYFYRDIYSPE